MVIPNDAPLWAGLMMLFYTALLLLVLSVLITGVMYDVIKRVGRNEERQN